MLKLIHADFYKTFHRAAYYLILFIFCGFAITIAVQMRGRDAGSWSGSFLAASQLLIYPVAFLPIITQITLGEEYREHTVKNTLAFGTNRCLLFCSKWVSTVLLGLLLTAAVFAAFFGSAALALPRDVQFSQKLVTDFFARLGAACVVYVAAATMSLFFLVVFNRNTLAIFLYYGAYYFTGLLLMLFHLNGGNKYLLQTQLKGIAGDPVPNLQKAMVISAVTMAAFFVAGVFASRRKDLI